MKPRRPGDGRGAISQEVRMSTTKAPIDPNWESLWDATDVAKYLKVSRSWVYVRAESGLLPFLRIGGLVRFEPEAIRTFARGAPKS